MPEKQEKTIARDVRVDRIGYVQELGKLWADELKKLVKGRMIESGLELVSGDKYQGKLSAGESSSVVNAAKVWKLFKANVITEKQLVGCMSISKSELLQFLSAEQVAKLCDTMPKSPSFTVTRIKGIDVTLQQAIEQIQANFAATA
jgi:hypothetical protein